MARQEYQNQLDELRKNVLAMSDLVAERWLIAYIAYYNHHRSHYTLENQTPIEALEQEGSI